MKKCLDNNLVPNGLKVYVEPSIGNRDDAFLAQWHSRLETFSKTLTTDVIGYCEAEIAKTKDEITAISGQLKALVSAPIYTNIEKTIGTNEKSRVNELTQRKNKKFYRLKYGNNDDRNVERNDAVRKNAKNVKNFNRPEIRDHPRVLYSNRGHRGMGKQFNDSSEEDSRNDARQGPDHRDDARRNARQKSDRNHDKRLLEIIEKRAERHPNYAAAVRGPERPNTAARRGPERPTERQSNQDGRTLRRNQSFNDWEQIGSRTEPIHERLALSRRNSRRNIAHTRDQETRKSGSNTDKDREILELKSRLEAMERERNGNATGAQRDRNGNESETEQMGNNSEKVTNHYYRDETNSSKNDSGAQRGKGPETNDLREMKSFLREVMLTISDFDKRLTTQINTGPTHSDK